MMDDLLNSAPCGFLAFTDDGTIHLANATLLEWLGHESLVGQPVDVVLSVGGRIFYQTHFFPLLRLQGRADEIYLSLKAKDRKEIPVLVYAVRREGENGPRNDCILVPVHQRNQYEDEILRAKRLAEEATRAKDEFLAVVSHELRTPLSAILGWTQLLRMGQLDEETSSQALETIERNARLQVKLIEDILDFARIVAGKVRLELRPVDLRTVIEAAVQVVQPAAQSKHIQLEQNFAAEVGMVSGDPDRLQQVMWNLLSNAVKFTPEGGVIRVVLERRGPQVEIAVSDTGQGISAEFLPHVFERFRQADKSSTRRQGGLGLGMAITRHLVEAHGGSIRVFSAGLGQGTTFTVALPSTVELSRRPEPVAQVSETTDATSGAPRLDGIEVLVVDDEQDARQLAEAVLAERGAKVTSVASVAEALAYLRTRHVDVVVSDIEMPNEDGYALIRQLRSLETSAERATPAVALTAHARASDRESVLAAGYQLHLVKPAEPAALVRAVAYLVRRSGART